MSMAHEYEILVKNLLLDYSEETLELIEIFEQKYEIACGHFEGCGWTCSSRIFKDGSIHGFSSSYSQQVDLYTDFQD